MSPGIENVIGRIREIQQKMQAFAEMGKPPASATVKDAIPDGKIDFRAELEKASRQAVASGRVPKTSDVEMPAAVGSTPFASLVRKASNETRLPPALLEAVMERESAFNPRAVSPKGAMGLMQLMPGTAKEMGVEDPFNPEQNILGGSRYLKGLLEKYDGDLARALSAYNAGPEAVKNRVVPPYEETRNYVKSVIDGYLRRSGVATEIDHAI